MSQEAQIVLGGKTFTIAKLGRKDALAVKQEIRRQRENPLELVLPFVERLNEEHGKLLLRQAYDDLARSRVVTAEDVTAFTSSSEGQIFMLWLMIRPFRSDITLEAIGELYDQTDKAAMKAIDEVITGLDRAPESAA